MKVNIDRNKDAQAAREQRARKDEKIASKRSRVAYFAKLFSYDPKRRELGGITPFRERPDDNIREEISELSVFFYREYEMAENQRPRVTHLNPYAYEVSVLQYCTARLAPPQDFKRLLPKKMERFQMPSE